MRNASLSNSAWVNVDAFPTGGAYQAILGKGSNATDIAYWLALRENSGSCYLIAGAGASNEIASWVVDTTDVWPTGKWVHVAATSDGTDWRLYFNGQQVDETSSAIGATSVSSAFRIGAFDNNGTPANFLAATIDEAAVFDSALTGAQIEQLYRIGAGSLAGQAGNGNITDDGTRLYAYDAFNRVIQVRGKSDGLLVATYTYDALGRRIRKVISNTGLPGTLSNDTIDYLYNGVQCVEERDGSDNEIRQYVWGRYVDELIQQREINGGNTDYYMLSDLLYRASVLTEDDGDIYETYDCDAYGQTQIFNSGSTRIYDPTCQFIFTGRRFDPETSDEDSQMYFYRSRYYSPQLGRFISRDPIGYAGGMNLYEYVGGMAVGAVDPEGLWYLDGTTAVMEDRDTLWGLSGIVFGRNSMYTKFGYTKEDANKLQAGTRVDLSKWLSPLRNDINTFKEAIRTMSLLADRILNHCCSDDKEAHQYLLDYWGRKAAIKKRLRDKTNPIWGLVVSTGSPLISVGIGSKVCLNFTGKWLSEFGVTVLVKTPANVITGIGIAADLFAAYSHAGTEPEIAGGHLIMGSAGLATFAFPVMAVPVAIVGAGKACTEAALQCRGEREMRELCEQSKAFYKRMIPVAEQRQKAAYSAEARFVDILKEFNPPPSQEKRVT